MKEPMHGKAKFRTCADADEELHSLALHNGEMRVELARVRDALTALEYTVRVFLKSIGVRTPSNESAGTLFRFATHDIRWSGEEVLKELRKSVFVALKQSKNAAPRKRRRHKAALPKSADRP